MATNLRPLHDRVVVKRNLAAERTASGLYIPDTAKEKPLQAEVIAVGEGKYDQNGKRIKLDVKKGDTVFVNKYGGQEIKIDDVEYTIIREDEILAVLD
jgi:chaperonin GroES